jgi:RyR domain
MPDPTHEHRWIIDKMQAGFSCATCQASGWDWQQDRVRELEHENRGLTETIQEWQQIHGTFVANPELEVLRAENAKLQARSYPDIEVVSARVHEAWMAEQRKLGRTSSLSRQTGEEFMVPYDQLTESSKEFDRATVRAVLAALEAPSAAVETR